ncbi:type VII secretion-associated serine protease mycosin [Streptomyces cinnamoneus]|uniref:type VII secretion-associated serine protease mycosin n=1 Tax=Streptomyces cinnamoneus TaxID=53446 RepID=UPI0037956ADD
MRLSAPFGLGNGRTAVCSVAVLAVLVVPIGSAQAETIRSQQWYLDAMHAADMWKTSTGAGVTVAVIDSGVDPELPDLRGQVLPGRDFSGIEGDSRSDYDGHGTEMAVLIAGTGQGNNGAGSFGLAPGVKVLPLRVINGKAPATQTLPGSAMASAIRYAADSEAKVINISMAGLDESREEAQALDYATSRGKLVIAGTGNWGKKGNPVAYPAAHPGVVGVAAVDQDIKATQESERGPQVDLAAPGDNIVTTCKGGTGVCRSHGTSDATALASASAALLWSAHPDWTANQVLRVLINTAGGPKSGEKRSDTIGYGVVRPRVALQNPGDPGPPDVSPLPAAAANDPATNSGARARGMDKGGGLLSTRNVVTVGVGIAIALMAGASVLVIRRRRA